MQMQRARGDVVQHPGITALTAAIFLRTFFVVVMLVDHPGGFQHQQARNFVAVAP